MRGDLGLFQGERFLACHIAIIDISRSNLDHVVPAYHRAQHTEVTAASRWCQPDRRQLTSTNTTGASFPVWS